MEPISEIDPSTNQLYFRGFNAVELARTTDFESVLFLLVNGNLPTSRQRMDLIQRMKSFRGFYTHDIKSIGNLIDRLGNFRTHSNLDLHDTLLAFVTLCPIIIANQLVHPKINQQNRELNHAANFLRLAKGTALSKQDVIDFQTALILPMDDPDNPSLSALIQSLEDGDFTNALHAALREHVGPLHHGAGTLAMEMLTEIQKPENAHEYLENRLNSGEKIFGLGHRIYRGIDPRAVILREMLERRVLSTSQEWLMHVSDAVAKEGRMLLLQKKAIDAFPNIDLYNAAVYSTFGFHPELNTSLFAISRAAGWMAHILELEGE
ncbi:MAG: citrate/2-methylcitrate synthase [Candidatus Thorarchaeota archaeon]